MQNTGVLEDPCHLIKAHMLKGPKVFVQTLQYFTYLDISAVHFHRITG